MKEKKLGKKEAAIFTILMGVVLIVSVAIGMGSGDSVNNEYASGTWYYEDTIDVKDGKMEVSNNKIEIDVDKDCSCKAHIKWGDADNIPGVLPLLVIRDEAGNEVAWVSGDVVDSELELDLTSGKYFAETEYYLTAEEFAEALNSMNPDEKVTIENDGSVLGYNNFGNDCTVTNLYEIEIHFSNDDTNFFLIGLIFGMLFAIVVFGVVMIVVLKNKSANQYDERQILVQGKSYKYGFFTLIGYFVIMGFLMEAGLVPFMEDTVVCVVGIMMGLLVYVGHALWNDAYFPLNENKGKVLLCLGLICVSNLLIGLANMSNMNFLTDGKLNFRSVNLICVFTLLVVIAEIIVKTIIDKKSDNE